MHSFLSVPVTLFISKGDLGVFYFKEVKSLIHLSLASHKRDIGKQNVASDQALHCLVEVLRLSQVSKPNRIKSSVVSLANHTFTGPA